ncbi:hypothetical protein [Larkinella rosea]|uniref:Uncharacterized protein n=1 Tax=Larkinella rosea TaxID=2025312 RepID=A0A3P1C149_9BACT|nr:hypothetical protein [Larkinella rosea]RRB07151.1 hypothetical protein EHT25_05055 [Larkinella rosea]
MRTALNANGFLYLAVLLLLNVSCQQSKDSIVAPAPPADNLLYTDLTGKEVKPGGVVTLDLNKDGIQDFIFETQLVGDAVYRLDKVQYLIASGVDSYLPINDQESMARFNKGDEIPLNDFNGFFWYKISSNVLVQKVISETKPSYWEGNWKASNHHFLPVQVYKNEKRFVGWIEISVDTVAEKLVLHKAALSTIPERSVKAGS